MLTRTTHAMVLSLLVLHVAGGHAGATRLTDVSNEVAGGYSYDLWLKRACDVSDALLEAARDRHGKVETPLWVGIIDPRTRDLVVNKPPNWMSYWDAEDYVVTAHGCNLYRDQAVLRAFLTLSETTGAELYRDAVEEYLGFYLRECPSGATGFLPWGEHMSYNCVRDRLTANRHEMEHNLPEWEMLWKIDPEATRRAIEAIYHYHIYDNEHFYYDRHGNYESGKFDPLPARGTYIKHSGLYAYSFMFLYSKTKEAEHLEWVHGISNLYWRHRDPDTGLIPGYASHGGAGGSTKTQLLLAYYLLSTAELEADPAIIERGLGMVDSYLEHGYDEETCRFAESLNPQTGAVAIHASPSFWIPAEGGEVYRALACWKAFERTGDPKYLDVVISILLRVADSPIAGDLTPQVAGDWLRLFLDVYKTSGDTRLLHHARNLAEWSWLNLVRNNFIIEAADGYVYHNKSLPGVLLGAWLRLYEVERKERLHWKAPDVAQANDDALTVDVRGENVKVEWAFRGGEKSARVLSAPRGESITVPIPDGVNQGPLALRFSHTEVEDSVQETQVLVAENPEGPRFEKWSYPEWIVAGGVLDGSVEVLDPSGLTRVLCRYLGKEGQTQTVPCVQVADNSSTYAFTIPIEPTLDCGSMHFVVAATGNPSWPVTRRSATREVTIARRTEVSFDLQTGQERQLVLSDEDKGWIKARVFARRGDVSGLLELVRIPKISSDFKGLPDIRLSDFIQVDLDSMKPATPELTLTIQLDPAQTHEAWTSSVAVYRLEGQEWARVAEGCLDRRECEIAATVSGDGLYVVSAEPRLVWKRSFNGALLSSPAYARISPKGDRALILDTRDPDGILYALNERGETIWEYDMDSTQGFVAIADVEGDGLDEIAVGGPKLALLECDGSVRWERSHEDAASPAIGDLNGDGALEVVTVTDAGVAAAYTKEGTALWETKISEGRYRLPSLGSVTADDGLEVLVGSRGAFYALSGVSGDVLWEVPIEGEAINSPAVGDLDGDGRDETVFYSRTDAKAVLWVLDDNGSVMWTAPTHRDSDWSPVICEFDGPGEWRVISQQPQNDRLGIYNAHGELTREINTPGKTIQTPVPLDLNGDGKLDLLSAFDIAMQVRAYANNGDLLWTYTPKSLNLPGAKIKGGGTLLVADLDRDGMLDVVGGDDVTWLHMIRSDTPCEPGAVMADQYRGDMRHSGCYTLSE